MNKSLIQSVLFFSGFALIMLALVVGPVKHFFWPLLLAETAIPETVQDDTLPDPNLQFTIVPGDEHGAFDTNGFANKGEVQAHYDIIALGDSQTAGSLVSWPGILSDKTGQSVYNMGVKGYGVAQFSYLLDKALAFHPQRIIIGLYMGQDVFNTYDIVYHLDAWKKYRSPNFVDDQPFQSNKLKMTNIAFRSWRDWLRAHSAIYRFIGDNTRILREELGFASPRTIGTTDWNNTDPDATLKYNKTPSQTTLFWVGSHLRGLNTDDKNILEGLRLSQVFLTEMNAKAKAHNAQLVVALIPIKEEVYAKKVEEAGQKNATYQKVISSETKLRDVLLDTCTKEKIACVDLLPYLQNRLDGGEVLYKPTWDVHPSALGYEAYADGIIGYLGNLKLHGI